MLTGVGIDIVDIQDLGEKIQESSSFLAKIFTLQELEINKVSNIKSLAGKIAAKEAIIKTGLIQAGDWHKIQILTDINGKPYVVDKHGKIYKNIKISISHTQNTAVAIAVLC